MRRNTEPKKLSRIVVTHAVDHLITHRNRAFRVAEPGRDRNRNERESRGDPDETKTRDERDAFPVNLLSSTSPRAVSQAIAEARKLEGEDSRFTIHHSPFGCMDTVLGPLGVRPSGVFLDLGISSPQFDDASRGFRPEQDGPLDLRFDVTRGEPASAFLRRVDRDELVRIIEEYGETTDPIAARRVADAVVLAREEGTLPSTTKAFAALVAAAKGKEYQAMHPAKLTFQALRIHLNQEFDEMRRGMRAAVEVMGDGGRLGVLTVRRSAFRTRAAAVFYFTAFSREVWISRRLR